jgi:heat shock protein HslJ
MKALGLFALLLSGCATIAGTAPDSGPYRALGTEPFWSVTVAGGRMTYAAPDADGFSVVAPPRDGGRDETARLTLAITHRRCGDGMSDRVYPDTVTATVDGRTLHGCGGAPLAPETLAGTNWSVVGIDGDAVRGDAYVLRFEDERLSGRAGCNSFGGPYHVEGDTLTAGPLMATRMACPGARMTHERNAMRVLGGPVRIDRDGDTMVLSGSGGEIRLRRAI